MSAPRKTWFEAEADAPLALMLAAITRAYEHRGRAARAAFLQRLEQAIPSPAGAPQSERRPHCPDGEADCAGAG